MAPRPVADPVEPMADSSRWHWLLLVPLVVVLIPRLYNKLRPSLFGIPFFYWYQLAVIIVGVGCTLLVHRRTRR